MVLWSADSLGEKIIIRHFSFCNWYTNCLLRPKTSEVKYSHWLCLYGLHPQIKNEWNIQCSRHTTAKAVLRWPFRSITNAALCKIIKCQTGKKFRQFSGVVTMKYYNSTACFSAVYITVWTIPITLNLDKMFFPEIKNNSRPFKELLETVPLWG